MVDLKIIQLHWSALTIELRNLHAGIDRLAAKFSNEHGPNSETAQRAEELSVAIQRLERALLQQQLHKIAAASGPVVGGVQ